eukprot:SAG22_NODE_612_length_8579_cov_3.684906_3_plen_84_part_00
MWAYSTVLLLPAPIIIMSGAIQMLRLSLVANTAWKQHQPDGVATKLLNDIVLHHHGALASFCFLPCASVPVARLLKESCKLGM